MKKHYINPVTEMIILRNERLLTTASADGIGYGGTDDGTHGADARRDDSWDSEEDNGNRSTYDSWMKEY